jgi:signal transduction histidine kinase
MTLQRKFSLLLVIVAASVVVIAGTSLWSVYMYQREVASSLSSIQSVLGGLQRVRQTAAQAGVALGVGDRELAQATIDDQLAVISAQLKRLENDESYLVLAGISTTRAISDAAARLGEAERAWASTGDPDARVRAIEAVGAITALVERVHERAIEDMGLATGHATELRGKVLFSLVVAGVSVVLVGGLGALLVRRWILRPVRRLREAASLLSRGNLSHRIPVEGGDELALLSSEVNAMAQMIGVMQDERIERERLAAVGEMVRRVAHNIRNPLAGIRSLAELTRSDLNDASPLAENQDRIVRTIDRFEGWVQMLLTATRPLQVSPANTAVRPWMQGIVDSHRPAAERAGVVLELDDAGTPNVACFDAGLLEQAVAAILDNAIGATDRGKRVRVEVTASAKTWEIAIRDEGPGVPGDIREKIFTPYFTTRRDGTGLGLAMAKQVVDQHSGRIEVESGAGGAVFRVVLPHVVAAGTSAQEDLSARA